jgi:hypothetical protein
MGCHPARSLIVAIAVLTCTLFIYPSDVRSYINLILFRTNHQYSFNRGKASDHSNEV